MTVVGDSDGGQEQSETWSHMTLEENGEDTHSPSRMRTRARVHDTQIAGRMLSCLGTATPSKQYRACRLYMIMMMSESVCL